MDSRGLIGNFVSANLPLSNHAVLWCICPSQTSSVSLTNTQTQMSETANDSAEAETETGTETTRLREYAKEVRDLPEVSGVDLIAGRYPPRLRVTLSGWEASAGFEDLRDRYGGEIVAAEADTESLILTVEVRNKWKMGGVRSARKEGGSVVLTLPREALEASGLDTGQMALSARSNEIHITSQDNPVDPR